MDLDGLHVDDEWDRAYFFHLLDNCRSELDYIKFFKLLSTLSIETLEVSLPSVADFIEKNSTNFSSSVETLLFHVLSHPSSTRGGRKACYSCLKLLKTGTLWSSFFVIVESLEEPQFHIIRPVLPRMDELVGAVDRKEFDFRWLKVILIRALLHSNGWIRLWALDKSLGIDLRTLEANQNFIFEWLFPVLNGNDLFWRLLERQKLYECVDLMGKVFNRIVDSTDDSNNFIHNVLTAMEKFSTPVAFFFISKALSSISKEEFLDGSQLFPLARRVLNRISYIQYPSLRFSTAYLLVRFFAGAVKWTSPLTAEIGSLTSYFSSETPGFFEKIVAVVTPLWIKLPHPTCQELLGELADDKNAADFYKFLWLRVRMNVIENEFYNMLVAKEPDVRTLRALLYYEDRFSDEVQQKLIIQIIQQLKDESLEFDILESLYLPLLKKMGVEMQKKALGQLGTPKSISSTHFLTVVSSILGIIIDKNKIGQEEKRLVKEYMGEELLAVPQSDRKGLSTKQYTTLLSKIQTVRIKAYLKLRESNFTQEAADKSVEECISQLDYASSFSVKESLLTVIAQRICEVNDSRLMLKAVNAAAAIVNEEKKSLNSLPAVFKCFEIAMQAKLLQDAVVEERTRELFDEFASTAIFSQSIALVLANVLERSQDFLPESWARQVLTIAIFGPVPKKDRRVLGAVLEKIYLDYGEILPCAEFERHHEVVQRARIKAFSVAIRCSVKNPSFGEAFVREIIKESDILDTSSSKSFGLSLAHRQKTRLVELLLFIMEYIKDELSISSVFDHCISCILDPCQQFSIKLIVEWILVRLCLHLPGYKEKLIGMEKSLAARRIGSISSWINMMVHLSRSSNDLKSQNELISVILPWTTAQNFAVRCTAIAGLTLIFNSLDENQKSSYKLVENIINFNSEPAGNSRRIIDNLLLDFYFAKLNMKEHLDFQSVLIELPTKTGLPQEETIPISLLQALNHTAFRTLNSDKTFLDAPSLVYASLMKNISCAPEIEIEEEDGESNFSVLEQESFQKKIITKERTKKTDCSLIVVASLIDKPTNLGGLCRTSEIFNVEKLILPDLLLTNDTSFKALSMSSEKWQKIEAVRPENLLPFLEQLRTDGYTVIAAEQTTDSVPLHKFSFPKKCVLLMGEEKEGVPTRLLRAVDQTVEIEQLGQTRSLNVHVTAALFIAKYAEQILLV